MNKITDFCSKVMADDNAKAKLDSILNGSDISSATDDQIQKISNLAKDLGFDISVNEVKSFLVNSKSLSEQELKEVAGGLNIFRDMRNGLEVFCNQAGGFGHNNEYQFTCAQAGGFRHNGEDPLAREPLPKQYSSRSPLQGSDMIKGNIMKKEDFK